MCTGLQGPNTQSSVHLTGPILKKKAQCPKMEEYQGPYSSVQAIIYRCVQVSEPIKCTQVPEIIIWG